MVRTALITGAYRGIGLEIARQLAASGVRVIVSARDVAKAEAAAAVLKGHGADVSAVALDVTDPKSVAQAMAGLERSHGGLDILVNNAAILIDGPGGFDSSLFDMTDDTVRRTFETNVTGPARMIQAVLPGMIARGYGRIVNLSSRAGQLADMGSGFPAYRMSKAALNALTRIAAAEARAANANADVKVNAACPGWCRTEMGGEGAERTASEGARTPTWLALLDRDGPTGGFFHDQTPIAW